MSLSGYTWQCGLKYIDIKLQALRDKDLLLLIEDNIRDAISSLMGDRYVPSDEKKVFVYRF